MPQVNPRMANAIRALAMDAVQKANSGHPGMPMGMAEIAVALWSRHLRHNPANPAWPGRDRFMLSNGHGSMLHYALLHLTGYPLSIDELRNFRQLHSQTPGHPEVGITAGIETTTGPLGQGLANAVGMALAEKLLAAQFNKPGFDVVDHHTYVFLGDGCLMEGISHEACSFAGTLRLNKLIALYDDNGISIDGAVKPWFSDDTPRRFEAYGWNVVPDIDGHDVDAVDLAIADAKTSDKPSLICCKTLIGKGAPGLEGGDKVHGSPLGAKAIAATREALGWPYAPFEIPDDVYSAWDARTAGARREKEWDELFAAYVETYPAEAGELRRRLNGELPASWDAAVAAMLAKTVEKKETIATRKASQNAIEALAPKLPEFLGGSADLTSSNLTNWSGTVAVRAGVGEEGEERGKESFVAGNHINYGVREFGMSAIINGIALHGGFIPYGGTFLTFSDYSRNALRMAALMKLRSIFVFTHDSIGLGEDGPTHQSVEHASALRLIPNLDVWRPADTTESAVAWVAAIERNGKLTGDPKPSGPSALLFSRQNVPYFEKTAEQIENIRRGAYLLSGSMSDSPRGAASAADKREPRVVLIATGSEVGLAIEAQQALRDLDIPANVVSMPSTTVFDRQPDDYKASVLPVGIPRVAIEAGVTDLWWKYRCDAVIGIDTFGESAPAGVLFKHFGLTVEKVVETVKVLVEAPAVAAGETTELD